MNGNGIFATFLLIACLICEAGGGAGWLWVLLAAVVLFSNFSKE